MKNMSVSSVGANGSVLPKHIRHRWSENDITTAPFPRQLRRSPWWTLPALHTEQRGAGNAHYHTLVEITFIQISNCWFFCLLYDFYFFLPQQSSKSAAERKAVSRPGGGLDGDLSCQGRMGEMSDMPRGCGSGSAAGGGMLGEMELGPSQGECLMSPGEVEESLSTHLSRKTAIISQFESKALGLDKAILHSIDCCGKKVVGGVKWSEWHVLVERLNNKGVGRDHKT